MSPRQWPRARQASGSPTHLTINDRSNSETAPPKIALANDRSASNSVFGRTTQHANRQQMGLGRRPRIDAFEQKEDTTRVLERSKIDWGGSRCARPLRTPLGAPRCRPQRCHGRRAGMPWWRRRHARPSDRQSTRSAASIASAPRNLGAQASRTARVIVSEITHSLVS